MRGGNYGVVMPERPPAEKKRLPRSGGAQKQPTYRVTGPDAQRETDRMRRKAARQTNLGEPARIVRTNDAGIEVIRPDTGGRSEPVDLSDEQIFELLGFLPVEGIDPLADPLVDAVTEGVERIASTDSQSALGSLAVHSAQVKVANALLTEYVPRARAEGHSWAKIGAAIGITPQAARKRWDATERAYHKQWMAQRYRPAGGADE